MPLWDKVKQELDRAGQVAQDALDEGRIRLESHRARQAADKAAQTLGYAVFRARQAGSTLDDAELSRHVARVAEHDAEVTRLESELAAMQQRWRAGGGMGAPPSSRGGSGYGDDGGSTAPTSPTAPTAPVPAAAAVVATDAAASGPPDVGPVGTPPASTGLETPPEASGGPVPPPANTPPETGTYGVIPPIEGVSGTAPETDKPTTDMWRKGDVYGHEPY